MEPRETTRLLAQLRDPAFLARLTDHLKAQHGPFSGDFGEGVQAGIRAAIGALPEALDALVPGLLPEPYTEGCGCAPGELCS